AAPSATSNAKSPTKTANSSPSPIPPASYSAANKPRGAELCFFVPLRCQSVLLIDVVFRFQALQQRLEKRFVCFGRSADRLRHLFRRSGKVALVGVDSRQRQMADPVVGILAGNLRIQLESPFCLPLPLQSSRVGIQLYRAGFFESCSQRLIRLNLLAH